LHREPGGDGRDRLPGLVAEPGLPFERLGGFRLLRRIGGGGMGVVFLAEEERLGRLVALKVIRPERAESPGARARFHREAAAVAKLRHTSIVAVYSAGEDQGADYIAMEMVPGKGLDEIIAGGAAPGVLAGAVPVPKLIRWFAEVARALDHAHREGVVHRDVKPSNIRITPEGRAMLLDFGLARGAEDSGVTVTGQFTGSPFYASPEQVNAGTKDWVSPLTDVYSLGVSLYQCVAAALPFEGDTTEKLFHRILFEEPVPPRRRNPSVTRDLETVILKAMEKERARRYPSAGALAADLEAILDLRPIAARPAGAAERMFKWSRRHRAATIAAVAVALAALSVPAVLLKSRWDEVARCMDGARSHIAGYREGRDRARALEAELTPLREALPRRSVSAGEIGRLHQGDLRLQQLRGGIELDFFKAQELLDRAGNLDARSDAVRSLRAELYVEKWRDAVAIKDPVLQKTYRELVERHDPDGRHREEILGLAAAVFTTDPAGAEVYLFRFIEEAEMREGGDRRLVPVPAGGEEAVRPGTWALRVLNGKGEIRANDLIVSVAGHPIRGTMLVAEASGTESNESVKRFDRLVSVDGAPVGEDLDLIQAVGKPPPEGKKHRFSRVDESPPEHLIDVLQTNLSRGESHRPSRRPRSRSHAAGSQPGRYSRPQKRRTASSPPRIFPVFGSHSSVRPVL